MKKFLLIICLLLLVGCSNNKEKIKNVESPKKETSELKEEVKEVILTEEDYKENSVNELGEIPIMMYHGIHNKNNSDTNYTGGNVDKDGYQRTVEAFRNDLDFYYQKGYRMIRLNDYVDGNINVELGKSPLVLTFDDGLDNNIIVTGLDSKGEIIIDPNSAVGVLEEYKKKYPDFNITATFFINGGIFNQPEYNEKILKWLVNNGYDVGNHTYSHVNFSNVGAEKSEQEVGSIYKILDELIPGKYVNIIALPFGSPYNLNHSNMPHIFECTYDGKTYVTKSALRVGWKAESSPYDAEFNPKFLKRIRAYDNDGVEFDIEMNFKLLENNRYISDGDDKKIVIPESMKNRIGNNYDKELITY